MCLLEKIKNLQPQKSDDKETRMKLENKRTLASVMVPASCLIFGVSTLAMLCRFEPF